MISNLIIFEWEWLHGRSGLSFWIDIKSLVNQRTSRGGDWDCVGGGEGC